MTLLLYPYETLFGDVSMNVQSADMDGHELNSEQIRAIERHITVYSLEKSHWNELTIGVSVSLPTNEIMRYDEQAKDVSVILRVQCDPTSARQSLLLTRQPEGVWKGAITLSSFAYERRAIMDAVVTVNDPERHIIGTSEPWRIDFLELKPNEPTPPPPSRRLIDCEYTSFSTSELGYLQSNKDIAAFVDLGRQKPTIWLNSDIPGLQVVLDSATGRAATAEGEMPANEISAKMWSAMFNAAVAKLEDTGDSDAIPAAPDGWHGHALNRILPELYRGMSPDEARRNARNAFREENAGMENMQSRLVPVVDRIVNSSKTLRNLLRVTLQEFEDGREE